MMMMMMSGAEEEEEGIAREGKRSKISAVSYTHLDVYKRQC